MPDTITRAPALSVLPDDPKTVILRPARGAGFIVRTAFEDGDGQPFDPTGWTWRIDFKRQRTAATPVFTLAEGAGITKSAEGLVIAGAAEQVALVPPQRDPTHRVPRSEEPPRSSLVGQLVGTRAGDIWPALTLVLEPVTLTTQEYEPGQVEDLGQARAAVDDPEAPIVVSVAVSPVVAEVLDAATRAEEAQEVAQEAAGQAAAAAAELSNLVAQGRVPALEDVKEFLHIWTDDARRFVAGITADGTFRVVRFATDSFASEALTVAEATVAGSRTYSRSLMTGDLWALVDEDGRSPLYVDRHGTVHIHRLSVGGSEGVGPSEQRIAALEQQVHAALTIAQRVNVKQERSLLAHELEEAAVLRTSGQWQTPPTNPSAKRFILTWIDDDGVDGYQGANPGAGDYAGGFYSRIHPVFVALNRALVAEGIVRADRPVAPCEAIIAKRFGDDPPRLAEALLLQNEFGWEILNHSWSHNFSGNPAHVAGEGLVLEHVASYHALRALGLDVESYVYPYGYHCHASRREVARLHRAGVGVSSNPMTLDGKMHNLPPLSTYNLRRRDMDAEPAAGLLDQWKAAVDAAAADGGWLICMSHANNATWVNDSAESHPDYPLEWRVPVEHPDVAQGAVPEGWEPYPGSKLAMLYDLLRYVYEQGGEVVTLRQGLDRYANLVDVGDFTHGQRHSGFPDDLTTYPHYVVGIDGRASYFKP